MSFLIQRVRAGAEPGAETIAGTALVQYVEGDSLLVGRGPTARLRFDEPTVSLEHARLQLREGRLEVADLGSLTGTYVNGKKVERAMAGERDWIEIGRHRLTVHLESPEAVVLYVQELAEDRPAAASADAGEGAAKVTAPKVDYLRAYGVGRLRLANLSWLAVGLAALVVALAAWWGRSDLFRPGPVSQAHAALVDRCGACHAPWRGVDDRRCATCHLGPEHQQSAAFQPSCETCHVEHRFATRLALVDDRLCVNCHRSLRLRPGAAPRFAHTVTDFAVDHPQFAIAGEGGARLRLDSPAARQADPGVLAFGHALHLRAGLKGPRGPVQLDCLDCHAQSRASGEIEPVAYERHCQDCHRLNFDPRSPEAPHERPEVVHAFLLRTYAERKQTAPPPLPVQRRLLPRRAFEAAPAPVIRLDERVLRQVVEAEVNLYRSSCGKCHGVDLGVVPPAITPVAIPARWLPYARFSHRPHRMVACATCHAGAAAS
ncbi:MAG TPA: FHA domain-containing protein, partial [Thermoanaerobaculia bacterium]|nr:FHA domain-containing protein [Thermoanaerobaculia bacterium]